MSLVRNLASMFAWQGMNYVLPLITLPYLARVLQPEQFGLLGFAGSVVAYAALVTDWGFSLTATRAVALHSREADTSALTTIFWNTILARVILAILSLAVLLVLIAVLPVLRQHAALLVIVGIGLVGNVITADWFLQGLEQMGRFATASMIGRAAPVPLIFLLVRSPDDVVIAAALQGMSGIIAGAISLWLAIETGQIRGISLSVHGAFAAIREAGALFLSNAAVSLYSNLNILVVFAIAGPVQGGLFVGADKIRRAAQGLITPVSLVMYPRIANLFARNGEAAAIMVRRLLLAQGSFTLALTIAIWIAAPQLVRGLLGTEYIEAVSILRALAPVLFLVGLSNVLGIQTMLPLGLKKEFMTSIIVPGLFSLLYMPLLAWWWGALGVAVALSVTEAGVTATGAVLLLRWLRGARPVSTNRLVAT